MGVCALLFCENPKNTNSNNTGVMVFILLFFGGLLFFINTRYNRGNTNNVNAVAEINPPIITVAKGFCTSAPALVLNAIGKKPKLATDAVIKTGLSLVFAPSIILGIISFQPSFSNRLKVAINTIPFRTATPNKAINPTPADILNGMSRDKRANTPPMALIGIAVYTKTASLNEWNVKYSKIKIKSNAIGTAIN